jgi:hypothetical protein
MLVSVSQSHFRDDVIHSLTYWGGDILDHADSITELEVVMDSNMSFSKHVDVTVGKTLAMMGLVSSGIIILYGPFMCPCAKLE